MINSLTIYLKEKLLLELPGEIAHQEVAPYRKVKHPNETIINARLSSVLILFYLKNNEMHTVLMQRSTYKGKHSGQISFPGGKKEPTDINVINTALREFEEEVGVQQQDVSVVGKLTDVFIPVSNFNVSPILGTLNYTPLFYPDKREVKEIIEIKISDLLNDKNLKSNKIKLENNTYIETPTFVFNQKIVWGATALMLNELKHILSEWKTSL